MARNKKKKRKKRKKKSNRRKQKKIFRSNVIDLFSNSIERKLYAPPANYTVDVPSVFSIIDAPLPTLEIYHKLASIFRNRKFKSLFINHKDMSGVDLAAELILDRIAIDMKHEAEERRSSYIIRGLLPDDDYLERYIRENPGSGLAIKHFRFLFY